jgi:tryptophanase
MSAKKDAFFNIGGFLAMHDEKLPQQCRNLLIINNPVLIVRATHATKT